MSETLIFEFLKSILDDMKDFMIDFMKDNHFYLKAFKDNQIIFLDQFKQSA